MAACIAYHHRLESAFLTDELTCASTSLAAVVQGEESILLLAKPTKVQRHWIIAPENVTLVVVYASP